MALSTWSRISSELTRSSPDASRKRSTTALPIRGSIHGNLRPIFSEKIIFDAECGTSTHIYDAIVVPEGKVLNSNLSCKMVFEYFGLPFTLFCSYKTVFLFRAINCTCYFQCYFSVIEFENEKPETISQEKIFVWAFPWLCCFVQRGQ